jgi:hypothetical protein
MMTTRRKSRAKRAGSSYAIPDGWCRGPDIPGANEVSGYLWEPWVPLGVLTLLVGNSESGKTTLLCRLIAHATGGNGAYIDRGTEPAPVLLMGAEDPYHSLYRPRLLAAGANEALVIARDRSRGPNSSALRLPECLPDLEDAVFQSGARLLVIDPIAAWASAIDLNTETATRSILDGLGEIARRLKVAVIGTRNFNKKTGGPLLNRINGSSAWRDVPRSILLVMTHPKEPGKLVLAHAKSSGPVKARPLHYHLASVEGQAYFSIDGPSALTLLDCEDSAASAGEREEWTVAEQLVAGLVGDEGAKASVIFTAAQAAGISKSRIYRVKVELKVLHERKGWGPDSYILWLPPENGWPAHLRPPQKPRAPRHTSSPTPPPPPPNGKKGCDKVSDGGGV